MQTTCDCCGHAAPQSIQTWRMGGRGTLCCAPDPDCNLQQDGPKPEPEPGLEAGRG